MRRVKQFIQDHLLTLTAFAAFIAILTSTMLVFVSNQGSPGRTFQFTTKTPEGLPDGTDIAGWATFDRDSFAVGEPITYRARVLYRPDKVEPDLDQFVRSVSFSPVEKRESAENLRTLASNINEFTLDIILQGVDVELNTTYDLDSAVLFYSGVGSTARELQSLRISTPTIFFTEQYPQNVSTVPLLPLKTEFNDSFSMSRGVIAICGGILLSLCIFLLWRFGRKRKAAELSETEVLWHEFHKTDQFSDSCREYILRCEAIVTRLLQSRTGLSPGEFWLGNDPEDPFWKTISAQMREQLLNIYRPEQLTPENASQVTDILNETFSSTVAEDVLNREKEPSFMVRIQQQPNVLVTSGICLALAAVMFTLAVFPRLWVSRDLLNYNDAVASLSDSIPTVEESTPFAELGDQSGISVIKAAALYNAGTIKAHMKPSNDPPMREQELLEVVFQEGLSLATYIDDPEESIEMFFASAGWLLEGKKYLQDAVRADPYDETIVRNLELVSKRHNAVIAAMRSLFESMEETSDVRQKSKLETMVDVLNLEWPDEVVEREEEEGDKPTYKVSEHF